MEDRRYLNFFIRVFLPMFNNPSIDYRSIDGSKDWQIECWLGEDELNLIQFIKRNGQFIPFELSLFEWTDSAIIGQLNDMCNYIHERSSNIFQQWKTEQRSLFFRFRTALKTKRRRRRRWEINTELAAIVAISKYDFSSRKYINHSISTYSHLVVTGVSYHILNTLNERWNFSLQTGTFFLGVLEAAVLAAMLYGIVQQLVWKSETYTRGACNSKYDLS